MSHHSRLLQATLPFTFVALGIASPANAQSAAAGTPVQLAAGPDDQSGSSADIVVTGTYARSLAEATEMKRRAAYGVDSIASTDIGKFPTQNVAEALQLVTGVAITRPRGEGLYVSVRGLGPQFQSTLSTEAPSRSTIWWRMAAPRAANSASRCCPRNSCHAST